MLPHQIKTMSDQALVNCLEDAEARKELKLRAAQLGYGGDISAFLLRMKKHPMRNVTGMIDDCIMGSESLRRTATAILSSGWDYTDPAGLMGKDAKQVEDILQKVSQEALGSFRDLGASTWSRMIKMIFDAYCRSVNQC